MGTLSTKTSSIFMLQCVHVSVIQSFHKTKGHLPSSNSQPRHRERETTLSLSQNSEEEEEEMAVAQISASLSLSIRGKNLNSLYTTISTLTEFSHGINIHLINVKKMNAMCRLVYYQPFSNFTSQLRSLHHLLRHRLSSR